MIGRWIAQLRKIRGWTQKDLAGHLGVDRTTLAKWEVGLERVPARALANVAHTLGVEPEQLQPQWTGRPPIVGLPRGPLYVPPYPTKGTVEEMLALGPISRSLAGQIGKRPALELELRERFPRDSPWELLAAYHLLVAGTELEFWSTDELGCPLLVTELTGFQAAGGGLRHALVWRLPNETMVFLPQVPLAVVSQSRSYRPDFLVLCLGKNKLWVDVEIDGKFHRETANEDARRTHGLGLPVRRYSNSLLLTPDFPQRLLNDLRKLDATWET